MIPRPRRRPGVILLLGLSSVFCLAGCQESGPVAIPSGTSVTPLPEDGGLPGAAEAPANSRVQGRGPMRPPRRG